MVLAAVLWKRQQACMWMQVNQLTLYVWILPHSKSGSCASTSPTPSTPPSRTLMTLTAALHRGSYAWRANSSMTYVQDKFCSPSGVERGRARTALGGQCREGTPARGPLQEASSSWRSEAEGKRFLRSNFWKVGGMHASNLSPVLRQLHVWGDCLLESGRKGIENGQFFSRKGGGGRESASLVLD